MEARKCNAHRGAMVDCLFDVQLNAHLPFLVRCVHSKDHIVIETLMEHARKNKQSKFDDAL